MSKSCTVAIQYSEDYQSECVPELVLLDDLVEEFRDMRRRIGEGAAAHGG